MLNAIYRSGVKRLIVTATLLCVMSCADNKATSTSPDFATVTGSVTYLQRIALPPEALVVVQLQDVTPADAPAEIIAEQRLERSGQVPIAFALRYDRHVIDPGHRYTVNARIMMGSRLLFASDKNIPVLTGGNPDRADLILQMAGSRPAP